MTSRTPWTRRQLLVAFSLYCRLPFGRIHHGNPEIIRCAKAIGRTPSALAMKLVNISGIDPVVTSSGRRGLTNASKADREMWEQMHSDWNKFVAESHQALDDCGLVPESEEGRTVRCYKPLNGWWLFSSPMNGSPSPVRWTRVHGQGRARLAWESRSLDAAHPTLVTVGERLYREFQW